MDPQLLIREGFKATACYSRSTHMGNKHYCEAPNQIAMNSALYGIS